MRKVLGIIFLLAAVVMMGTGTAWALESEDIILTVTIQILSVDVEDNCVGVGNAWGLEFVVAGNTCSSWVAAPGGVYTAAPADWQDGVLVTNDGNGDESFGLVVACTGGTAWTNDTAGNDDNVADADEFVYRAVFDAVGTHTLGADDRVGAVMAKAEDSGTGSRYTDGDDDGESVAAAGSALLFVQLDIPSSTTETPPTEKTLTLTISAETTY